MTSINGVLLLLLSLVLATKADHVKVRLSNAELEEMYWASYLSEIVYYKDWVDDHLADMRNYNDVSLDVLKFWRDEPDASIVAKVSNVNACYGVFRGTLEYVAKDWAQNIDPVNIKRHGCKIRRAWWKGVDTSFQKQFDASLKKCMADCPQCKLILTGHSQVRL